MEISVGDRDRFACCYLYMSNKQAVDWNAAATAFSTKIKVESFRTVTSKAVKAALTKTGSVKTSCSETDLGRFAFCFIYSTEKRDVDWEAASREYNAKTKPESFKTVTMKALKKLGVPTTNGEVKPNGKKRKAQSDGEEGDEDGAKAVKKTRKGRKPKIRVEPEPGPEAEGEQNGGESEALVKGESPDDQEASAAAENEEDQDGPVAKGEDGRGGCTF